MSERPPRRLPPERYSDFTLVGKGGMGVVYLALDSELNRRVAFKMVLPDPKADRSDPAPRTPLEATPPDQSDADRSRSFQDWRNRFLQEAWVTGAMEHPGIVPVYELGETEEGIPYYTMRYVTGERTLKSAIEDADSFDDRLALLEPFLKICDTIRYAHARGVAHRDLKPENIALGSFGEVIVLDWGLAKAEGQPDSAGEDWRARIDAYRDATDFKTVAGALGTPGFMAPEAALGRSEEVDARSDVYSLGAILFQILTGKLPFRFANFLEYVNLVIREDAPRADRVDDAVPGELADVCARALQREASDRYAGVGELATAVRRWQIEGPIEREIRGLLVRAHDEIEAGRDRTGTLLLLHLDRATAAVNRVLHLRPDQEDAQLLLQRLKTLRERGIHERVKTERVVVLQRVAAALLGVGAIVALVVFGLLSEERERAASLQQANRDQLIEAELKASHATHDARLQQAALARSLATLANSALEDRRGGAARVLAAAALLRDSSPAAWHALADAELAWTPTLRWIVHGVDAATVAFDPDNPARLVIGDDEGGVHEIDFATTPPRTTSYEACNAGIGCVACITIDGKACIAAGSTEGQVAILAPGKAGPVLTMPAKLPPAPKRVEFEDDTLYRGASVTAIAPGPREGLLVGYADGRLRQFDRAGELLHTARHHAAAITSILRASDPDLFCSASMDGAVNWWRDAGLVLDRVWTTDPPHPLAGIRLDPDGGLLEAWSADGSVISWSLDSGEPAAATHRAEQGSYAALVRNNQVIVIAGADGRLAAYDRLSGDRIHEWIRPTEKIVDCAASRGRPWIAVAGDDGAVRIWDLAMRTDVAPRVAVAAPRRKRVVEARADGILTVLDANSADPVELDDPLSDSTPRITAMALSPEGDRLLTADLGGRIEVWNVDEARRIRSVKGTGEHLTAIAWAEGEGRFFTGNLDGNVRAWHWPTGQYLTFDAATDQPIALLARAADTRRIAAADTTGAIHVWNSHERTVVRGWTGSGPLMALALSPNAGIVAAVRVDAMLVVWDGKRWVERGKLPTRSPILAFEVDDDAQVRWVSGSGGLGAETTLLDGPALPTQRAGGSWILIGPVARMERCADEFGLELDETDFSVRPIAIRRFRGALRVGR